MTVVLWWPLSSLATHPLRPPPTINSYRHQLRARRCSQGPRVLKVRAALDQLVQVELVHVACHAHDPLVDHGRGLLREEPELKGSIGEGPNQTDYSDQSSVRILSKFRNFRKKIQKFRKISTFSKISAKFRQNFINIWAKINEKNLKITNFNQFLQKIAKKCENVWRNFSEILRSERCKSM